jgi:signal peptidase I
MIEDNPNEIISNSEQLNNLTAELNPARDFWNFLLDLLKTGVIVFVIAFLLRYFAIQPYIVEGISMMPNYENREYLLAEKLSYSFGQPNRGDVVIFRYPKNPSVNYIKRIIALPGEKIKIANNAVTIYNTKNPNGMVLDETYIPTNSRTYTSYENGILEQSLKDNEYFVMGDNRENSSDSREWGVLPKGNIVGRSWLTLIPIRRAGFHSHHTYSSIISPTLQKIKLAFSGLK